MREEQAAVVAQLAESWSSLVEVDEGSYRPNCQTNLVIVLLELSLLFRNFINTTDYILPLGPIGVLISFYLVKQVHGRSVASDNRGPCI